MLTVTPHYHVNLFTQKCFLHGKLSRLQDLSCKGQFYNAILTMFCTFTAEIFYSVKEITKGLIKCGQGFCVVEHLVFALCLMLVCSSSKATDAIKFRSREASQITKCISMVQSLLTHTLHL